MKQDEIQILHALRLDGQPEVATLLDLLFARVEELEREVRRQRTIVGGLVEHEQAREEAETGAAMLRRIDRAVNPAFASTLKHFSPLVPSEPRD